MTITRRGFVAGSMAVVVTRQATARPGDPCAAWTRWKRLFLASEGRVIDTDNGGISHSEGQAYGMVLATAHDDRPAFGRLWRWTRQTLRRPDGLFAWKYQPTSTGGHVADVNNATDGDLMIAWALVRAAERWEMPDLVQEALAVASAITRHLVFHEPYGPVLRPGLSGFQFPDRRIVNLSYWVWPALDAIAGVTQDGIWTRIGASGLALLRRARFGPGLPPDWLDLVGGPQVATDYSSRFGYDAVRVPLYLVWGGRDTSERLAPFVRHWSRDPIPAWTDLKTGQKGGVPAPTGLAAVAELVRARAARRPARFPCLTEREGYYSGTLLLLAQLAEQEAKFPA